MVIFEMLRKHREKAGISQAELAKKLSVPADIISYLEDPAGNEERMIQLLAKALGMTPGEFKVEVPPEPDKPTEKEIKTVAVQKAKFPNIREFILDPVRCENPEKALELFREQELSLAEKNLILYLSTTALYHFCDTNTSSFGFDAYLFKLHGSLLARFDKELQGLPISAQEKEERLGNARTNIFACDSIENIAIRVLEPFAQEMEQKLSNGILDFDDDLDMPFTWGIDNELMKIEIKDSSGTIRDRIKLLDVKERV